METTSRDRAIEALDDVMREAVDPIDMGSSNLAAAAALDFIAAALHRGSDDAEAIRQTLGLTAEWASTDRTSVDLELWPSDEGAYLSREAAVAGFVGDGDDVLLRRVVGDWRESE